MIRIKNIFDAAEKDDGIRIWVEPIDLTRDLREWCRVDHVLRHLGPPRGLRDWFEEHPDGYDYFRATYHEWLARSPFRKALLDLAAAGRKQTFTLLHQGDDPARNTAAALHEFLLDMASSWQPDTEP